MKSAWKARGNYESSIMKSDRNVHGNYGRSIMKSGRHVAITKEVLWSLAGTWQLGKNYCEVWQARDNYGRSTM